MLSTDKISGAFVAIIEEAEKLQNTTSQQAVAEGLRTIISIAKHQSDIRNSPKGSCPAEE